MAIFSQLSSWLFFLLAIFLSHGFQKLEASHKAYNNIHDTEQISISLEQTYRTSFHFQPPQNWINDPNGPVMYKGVYHLFYQYNPLGAVWGNIVWAHSTSTDLVNWTPQMTALKPSQPSDINGVWSGSVTMLQDGKPVILYTGINRLNQQVQNLAEPKDPSDPLLLEWVKLGNNPIMAPTPSNGINGSSFRDPTTAWLGPDKLWRVIVGSKIQTTGAAILYKSRDFRTWIKAKKFLHSAVDTGMWECPDFFPVAVNSPFGLDTSQLGKNVKHVLKISLDDTKHDYYTIGTYDIGKDVYTPDKGSVEGDDGMRYDYGKFYASKTFFDGITKRRILWGWINESSSVADDIKKGWSGIQGIPRTIVMDQSGKQLIQWPVVEIEKLRGQTPFTLANKILKPNSLLKMTGVTPSQADVDMAFKIIDFAKAEIMDPKWTDPQILCSEKSASVGGNLGPFGLLTMASQGLKEYTAIFFRIFKAPNKFVVLMCSDQSRSSLNLDNDRTIYGTFLNVDPVSEVLSLRTLIDSSVVESFGGRGKAVITSRVYPILALIGQTNLYAFNYGTQNVQIANLSAYSMNEAQIN